MQTSEGSPATEAGGSAPAVRIVRHALADRVFHWVTAASVLVLLGTAFLPVLGFTFAWVNIHWITGLVLLAAVLFHIVRASFRQSWRAVWIGRADLRDAAAIMRNTFSRSGAPPAKPGKYSFAQKLIHHMFALVILATLVTGVLMLLRIDTPWWNRNPYVLGNETWGIIYVLHGLGALLLITMVMLHVYFALRPEKLLFTRAMLRGWITRQEYAAHHDPKRWQVDP
jgi:cytochrome b subunit of formate dehydrogenase